MMGGMKTSKSFRLDHYLRSANCADQLTYSANQSSNGSLNQPYSPSSKHFNVSRVHPFNWMTFLPHVLLCLKRVLYKNKQKFVNNQVELFSSVLPLSRLLTRVTVARRSSVHRLWPPMHLASQRSRSWVWYRCPCWLSSLPCNRPCCQNSFEPSLTGPASRLWPGIALVHSHPPMPFICSLRWHYKA